MSNTSLAASFSLFLGGRIDLTFAARLSCVFGWNNSINWGGSTASTVGLAFASFKGSRFTDILGSDIKKVVGLDAKHVSFAFDIKDVDLNKTLTKAESDTLTAKIKGLSAESGELDAEIKFLKTYF
jgi:hypothetical protein